MSSKEPVRRYAHALEKRDWPAFADVLAPDVVYELPQTRERIRGRDRYVRFNQEYPGDWHIEPQIIVEDDAHGAMLFRWSLPGESSLAAAFFEIDAGKIAKIIDLWPEPYEPPRGREHLAERWSKD